MLPSARELNATFPSCPHCSTPLLEMSDMWGIYYGCEECGYEQEAAEAELEMIVSRHGGRLREVAVAEVEVVAVPV